MAPGCARARRICSAISPAGQPFPLLAHAKCREAGPEGPSRRVLPRPPREQRGEALLPLVDRPVELRGEVVHPAALEPRARVGRDLLVRVESLHLRRAPRPPDAEGADAHAHVLLPRPSPRREGASRTCSRSTGASPHGRGRHRRRRTSRSSGRPGTPRRFRPRPSRDTGRSSRRGGCRPRRNARTTSRITARECAATSSSPGSIQSCFP